MYVPYIFISYLFKKSIEKQEEGEDEEEEEKKKLGPCRIVEEGEKKQEEREDSSLSMSFVSLCVSLCVFCACFSSCMSVSGRSTPPPKPCLVLVPTNRKKGPRKSKEREEKDPTLPKQATTNNPPTKNQRKENREAGRQCLWFISFLSSIFFYSTPSVTSNLACGCDVVGAASVSFYISRPLCLQSNTHRKKLKKTDIKNPRHGPPCLSKSSDLQESCCFCLSFGFGGGVEEHAHETRGDM